MKRIKNFNTLFEYRYPTTGTDIETDISIDDELETAQKEEEDTAAIIAADKEYQQVIENIKNDPNISIDSITKRLQEIKLKYYPDKDSILRQKAIDAWHNKLHYIIAWHKLLDKSH